MSDIIIREDGTPKQLSPTRLATKSDNSTVNWIPEQITNLARITINSNGEYLASNDGYYGYAIVNVCVAGGNEAEISGDPYVDPVTDPQTGEEYTPDHEVEDFTGDFLDPELEPPTKVTPPPNSKTGTQSGKVMGIDPDTGEYVQVSVDENGDLVYEAAKFPTKIRILTPPAKLEYAEGEKINYAGLKVSLLTEDDEVFVNDDFPWGYVPWQPVPNALFEGDNLITPMEYAPTGVTDMTIDEFHDYTLARIFDTPFYLTREEMAYFVFPSHEWNGSMWFTMMAYRVDSGSDVVAALWSTSGESTGSAGMLLASREPFTYSEDHQSYREEENPSKVPLEWTSKTPLSTTSQGRKYYHALLITSPTEPEYCSSSKVNTSNPRGNFSGADLAYEMLYGSTDPKEVPVRWKSPYDGNTYETSFGIEVTE